MRRNTFGKRRRGNVSRCGVACIWTAALSLAVGAAGRVFADATTVVSGLDNPNDLQLYDGNLYFVDTSSHANDTLADVSTGGGISNVLFSGLANYEPDIGGYSGIGNYSVGSAGIFGGYGDYDNTTMFAGNPATGTTQTLASSYGGIYLAQSDGNVYYSSNFRDINAVPATGGSSTTVASGVWVRGMTTDTTGAYFQDYWSQDILKFSYATQSVSTLTGPQNASPFATDSGSLYINVGGGGIDSVAQTGGTPTTLISGSVTGYAATNGNVFYTNGKTIEQYSVPIAVPADADFMSFDFQMNNLSSGDFLSAGVGDTLLFQIQSQFIVNSAITNSGLLDVSQWAGQDIQLFLGLNVVDDANIGGTIVVDNISFEEVPEPSALLMMAVGTVGLWKYRRGVRRYQSRATGPF